MAERPSISPDLEEDFLAANGSHLAVDDNTIYGTPAPVAASTVARGNRLTDRFHGLADGRGSFIDGISPSRSLASGMEDLSFIKMNSLEGSRPDSQQADKGKSVLKGGASNAEDIQSRSSLGLIPVDQMEDLSSSMLHYEMSPVKVAKKPSIIEERTEEFSASADLGREGGASGYTQNASLRRDVERSAAEGLAPDILNIVGGGMVFGGQSSNYGASEDLDASVVDVKINAEELEQFDEEFSDFGDFDDTMTSELPDILQNEPPDGAASVSASARSVHNDMYTNNTGIRNSDMFEAGASRDSGITSNIYGTLPSNEEADVEIEALGQRMEATGERAEDQIYGRDGVGSEDQGFHARIHSSFPRQSDVGTSRLDSRYFNESPMMHGDGDGQEEEDFSLYPRQSTIFPDDPSVTAELTRQGPAADHPRPAMVAQGRNYQEGQESSEIDTDDEIAAVRQENAVRDVRQRGVGTSMDSERGSRPGLEGGSSEENDVGVPRSLEPRQSAEGDVVMSPVPGDGGGGGDGSSGHSSDDDILQGATGGAAQGSTNSSAQARDFLRELGFLGQGQISSQHNPFQRDDPEELQRVRPQGEDLMSSRHTNGQQRRVRFVSPANRVRMLSGASTEDDDNQVVQNQDPPQIEGVSALPDESSSSLAPTSSESFHMSMYLAPSHHQMSMASETSRVGFEESTFNLADLVRHNREVRDEDDESGIGHAEHRNVLSPQPGQSDDTLSDQALFAEDDDEFPDITFSKNISFGNVGEFSQLQPTGSPLSDISDRRGSKESRTSAQLMPPPPIPDLGKQFITEDSPVYINEEGEGVTDLAYYHPFVETSAQQAAVYNPFDTSGLSASSVPVPESAFDEEFGDGNFGAGEFKEAGKELAMFEEDEEEFKKEHMFDQGDIQHANTSHHTNTSHHSHTTSDSLGLPDSWSMQSAVYPSNPSFLDAMEEAASSRISIGTFMGFRTEHLGSLDGMEDNARPNFGTKIVTPPDRRPVALIDRDSPPACDLHEGQGHNSDDLEMEVRGSGVGSDIDVEVGTGSRQKASGSAYPGSPVTKSGEPSIRTSTNATKDTKTNSDGFGEIDIKRTRPTQDLTSITESKYANIKSGYATSTATQDKSDNTYHNTDCTPTSPDDDCAFEAAGTMDISAISKLILTASNSAGSEDLAELILKVSKSSSASTDRDGSTSSPLKSEAKSLRDEAKTNSGFDRQPDGKSQNITPQKSRQAPLHRGNIDDINEPVRKVSPVTTNEDRNSLRRKSAEGKAEDSTSSLNKKSKVSKIPTFGGRKYNLSATGSDRQSENELNKSALDGDSPVLDNVKGNESRNEAKPPIGKVVPMPSFERDEFSQEQSKWKSPRASTIMPRTTRDDTINLPRLDLASLTVETDCVRVVDGLSASQHERQKLVEAGKQLKNHACHKPTAPSNSTRNNASAPVHLENSPPDMNTSRSSNSSNEQLTPQEQLPETASKNRYSSTPMNPSALNDVTLPSSAEHVSLIDPSPSDRFTFLPSSAELTFVTPEDDKIVPNAAQKSKSSLTSQSNNYSNTQHQSTPKCAKSRSIEPRAIHVDDLTRVRNLERELTDINAAKKKTSPDKSPSEHLEIWKPENSIKAGHPQEVFASSTAVSGVPTLLTSQSLSKTPFASQYLTSSGIGTFNPTGAVTSNPRYSSPHPSGSVLSNLTPISAMGASRLYSGSPLEQYSSLSSYHLSPSTFATLSHGTLLSTGMTTLAESTDFSRAYGQVAELRARLPFSDSTRSDYQTGGFMRTAPAGLSVADTHVTSSSLQHGVVTSSLASQLSSRTTHLTREELAVADVPHDVLFEEVCCVGLSCHSILSIKNPSSRWLQVRIECVAVFLNGLSQDPAHVLPFVMKEKCVIEPNATENVKIVFAPRETGEFMVKLQIESSHMIADHALQPSRYPQLTTLRASAEHPNIQVLTEGQAGLDYGALPWGASKCLPITLINRGRANVPVRLALSASSWHCFTFERLHGSRDTSVVTGLPRASSLSPSVVNVLLPAAHGVHVSPVSLFVYCKAPNNRREKTSTLGPPEKYQARVEVEVDTPAISDPLALVDLFALVGTVRLHAPRDTEEVRFRAEVGRSEHKVIPLRNAGNIPLEVNLEVTHWPDFFTVIPNKLPIDPGCEREVIVKFQPKHANAMKFESLLFMSLEPDSQSYEIQLVGEVSRPTSLTSHPRQNKEPLVYSNKHYLTWGGVQIGRALQQCVMLKNMSENIVKLKVLIGGNCSEFQLQSYFADGQETVSSTKDIVMKPREEFPVRVLFAPSRVAAYSAKLQIRQEMLHGVSKYAIPLTGYGGVSHLELEDMHRGQMENFWRSIGHPTVGQNTIIKVVIRNTGDRAAYVKALPFKDLGCKESISGARLTIQPNEICLNAKQTQTVVVVFNASERESSLCQERNAVVATVAFFYGDEISRQKYRKSLKLNKTNPIVLSETNPVRGVNFDVTYQDEDLVVEGTELRDTPNDVLLFHSTMNKISLALVGESAVKKSKGSVESKCEKSMSPAPSQGTRRQLTTNSPPVKGTPSMYEREPTRSSSTPVKPQDRTPSRATRSLDNELLRTAIHESKGASNYRESFAHPFKHKRASLPPSTSSHVSLGLAGPRELPAQNEPGEFWSLRPDHIIIPAPNKDSEPVIKRIQIVNYTERSLSYECMWPAHCITLTPEQGAILPRSTVLICVSANCAIRSKGILLPWKGQIHVNCDGTSKAIRVQIRDDLTADDSVIIHHEGVGQPLTAEGSSPMVEISTPNQKSRSVASHVKMSKNMFSFPATKTGRKSELPLDITNTSAYPVKWVMSSFAPPYVKEDDGLGVYRAMYAPFSLGRQAGLLMPQESTKAIVNFSPREVGQYSQFWEVKTQSEATVHSSTQTTKLELIGQGTSEHVTQTLDSLPLGGTLVGMMANRGLLSTHNLAKTAPIEDIKSIRPSLVGFRHKEIDFPVCKVGKRDKVKAEIRNKGARPQVVELTMPHPPFYIQPSHQKITIHPSKYVRVPIEFRPELPGKFKGVLIGRNTDNSTMLLELHAEAQ